MIIDENAINVLFLLQKSYMLSQISKKNMRFGKLCE